MLSRVEYGGRPQLETRRFRSKVCKCRRLIWTLFLHSTWDLPQTRDRTLKGLASHELIPLCSYD